LGDHPQLRWWEKGGGRELAEDSPWVWFQKSGKKFAWMRDLEKKKGGGGLEFFVSDNQDPKRN